MPIPPPSAEPTDAADPACGAQHCRAVLHALLDRASDMLRLVHEQALRQAEQSVRTGKPAPDSTVAFERIARGLRRAVALAQRLDQPAAPAGARPPSRAAERPEDLRPEDLRPENPHAGSRERRDAPDADDSLNHLPLAEAIAVICRDLGLALPPGIGPGPAPADLAAALAAWAAAPPVPLPARCSDPPGGPPKAAPKDAPDDALADEMARLLRGAPRFQPGGPLDPVAAIGRAHVGRAHIGRAHRALDGPDGG